MCIGKDKEKMLPTLIFLFQLSQKKQFDKFAMIEAMDMVLDFFPNLRGHLTQDFSALERKIDTFPKLKMRQQYKMTGFEGRESIFTSNKLGDNH